MDFSLLYLRGFVHEWDRQRLTDADLQELEQVILDRVDSAPVIRGTGGLRKVRFAPPSWRTGKSGALRVGFACFRTKALIVVVAMFAKNEAVNFTAAERVAISRLLKRIEEALR